MFERLGQLHCTTRSAVTYIGYTKGLHTTVTKATNFTKSDKLVHSSQFYPVTLVSTIL